MIFSVYRFKKAINLAKNQQKYAANNLTILSKSMQRTISYALPTCGRDITAGRRMKRVAAMWLMMLVVVFAAFLHLWRSGALAGLYEDVYSNIIHHSMNADMTLRSLEVEGGEYSDICMIVQYALSSISGFQMESSGMAGEQCAYDYIYTAEIPAFLDHPRRVIDPVRVHITARRENGHVDIVSSSRLPLLMLDVQGAHDGISSLGWVKHASLKRDMTGGRLHIKLEERQPEFIWHHAGRAALVDTSGIVINMHDGQDISDFSGLPIIKGEDAPAHARKIKELIEREPLLRPHIFTLSYVQGRRLNVLLDNGVEVMLPEHGAGDAWSYVAQMQRRKDIFSRRIEKLDLRINDRVYITLAQ